MIPEVGQKLGPYEVLGWLAGGGMAGIFRAWDGRLHREVAIKLVHDGAAMAEMRERFLREARVVSGLNHPNICTIFDIGEQDGELYLVMELLEGETLRERIAAGPLPLEETVRYAREVAEALALAHSRGVVHRDIKPANIFLANKPNGDRQAKLLDFGLAKQDLDSRGRASGLTKTGATVGTISYMSPEQARGEELDARSDLFSLGVVLYEMATGHPPFKGTTSALVFVQLLSEDAPRSAREWMRRFPGRWSG
jgi:serine/threonine protein kinase